MALANVDLVIITLYLCLTLIIGFWGSRKAKQGIEEFFLAGRRMTWFMAGTSMVATTFAADTPLWVTGEVARHGIAGNWLWWNMAIGHLLAAVIFAPLWRRSRVITDAELIELRYGKNHRPATLLRSFKAAYFSLIFNIITMGWVILAMKKIIIAILGVESGWAMPILIGFVLLTMVYSVLGGLVSVIVTDLVQFILGMAGALILAVYSLKAVGGLGALPGALAANYPNSAELLSFFPLLGDGESAWMPASALAIYLGIQWWSQKGADGGGYFVQRMGASQDGAAASKATFWFSIAHYALRPWPWILVALCALVIFPMASNPGMDREATYPLMITTLLPAGLKGVVICSLLAAFMSTIDTHLNWGTSYLVRDIYQRFIKPAASDRELVLVSRLALVLMTGLAIILAFCMDSIQTGWEIFFQLGAGWGAAMILRWLWWRTNAESELAAIITATVATVIFQTTGIELAFHFKLLFTTILATSASLAAVFIWPVKAGAAHLSEFYKLVTPPGWWRPVIKEASAPLKESPYAMGRLLFYTVCGTLAVYGLLFGIGKLLFAQYLLGTILLIVGLVMVFVTWRGIVLLNRLGESELNG